MLVKDGRAVMPFGVMGGQYQAVGHATFLHQPARSRHGPAAGRRGAARLRVSGRSAGRAFRPRAESATTSRGAATIIEMLDVPIGGCQAIWIDRERGALIGGSEPRKDGLALGY